MSLKSSLGALTPEAPCILIVDDDRRVLELLEFALSAQGFRTVSAGDGEQAIRQARETRPDLVVLDVRLPKKSGLEVCDSLRRDGTDPTVPIIIVSASSETEARLQALARGADDYLAKPFSPKELVARIQRLLARSADGRAARARTVELERELARTRDEARRAHESTRREQHLRQLVVEVGPELQRTLDAEAISARLLDVAMRRLGLDAASVLVPGDSGRFEALSAIGRTERLGQGALSLGGELASYLTPLSKPAECHELERLPELRPEVAALSAGGAALLAPLVCEGALVGVFVANQRAQGRLQPDEREWLGELVALAAASLANALRVERLEIEMVELLAVRAESHLEPHVASALMLAARRARLAARGSGLPARCAGQVQRVIRLGDWLDTAEGLMVAGRLGSSAPSGAIARLTQLRMRSDSLGLRSDDPLEFRAATLVALGRELARALAAGCEPSRALERAAAVASQGDPLAIERFASAEADADPADTPGRAA